MAWWKKNKKPKKILSCKEAAMMLKSAANTILQDFTVQINPVEIVIINNLISYMDVLVMKCYVNGILKHTNWISARLLESRIVLQVSNEPHVKTLVNMIKNLEELIESEKGNGKKENL